MDTDQVTEIARVGYAKGRAGYGFEDTPSEPRRTAYTNDADGTEAYKRAQIRWIVFALHAHILDTSWHKFWSNWNGGTGNRVWLGAYLATDEISMLDRLYAQWRAS